ncbi:MAG: TerB family tellurite resistance protein [Pseudomonadota bacterium]
MIDDIRKFFAEKLNPPEDASEEERRLGIQYATAALLIEVAKSDFDQDEMERALIFAMLKDTFELLESQLNELVSLADKATQDAHDIYQFTQLVNDAYSYEDKTQLITNLWRVAFADGRIDRYEEQFIRKVCGLLHVAHPDFIKAKLTAEQMAAEA